MHTRFLALLQMQMNRGTSQRSLAPGLAGSWEQGQDTALIRARGLGDPLSVDATAGPRAGDGGKEMLVLPPQPCTLPLFC